MRNALNQYRFFSLVLLVALLILSESANAGTCFVWKVTNAKQPFYMVGTVHALAGNDYPLPKGYDEALHNSQRLIFEIQPDPKSDFSDKFDIAATYPKGDTNTVWQEEQRFRKIDPGADARLLDMRNVKWVPKIRAEIDSGKPTAIVVGSAHMLGPNGLISLLERNGYKFEQL